MACSFCRSDGMMGFRYRCQQCFNYQLCQNCFWRGHASGNHNSQHEMKEHSSWVRISSDGHGLFLLFLIIFTLIMLLKVTQDHNLVSMRNLKISRNPLLRLLVIEMNEILKVIYFYSKYTFLDYNSKFWGR